MASSQTKFVPPAEMIEREILKFIQNYDGAITDETKPILLFPWNFGPLITRCIRYIAAAYGLVAISIQYEDSGDSKQVVAVCKPEFVREYPDKYEQEEMKSCTSDDLKAALERLQKKKQSGMNVAENISEKSKRSAAGGDQVRADLDVAGQILQKRKMSAAGGDQVRADLDVAGQILQKTKMSAAGGDQDRADLDVAGQILQKRKMPAAGGDQARADLNVAGQILQKTKRSAAGGDQVRADLDVAGQILQKSKVSAAGGDQVRADLNVAGQILQKCKRSAAGGDQVRPDLNVAGQILQKSKRSAAGGDQDGADLNVAGQILQKTAFSGSTGSNQVNAADFKRNAVMGTIIADTPAKSSKHIVTHQKKPRKKQTLRSVLQSLRASVMPTIAENDICDPKDTAKDDLIIASSKSAKQEISRPSTLQSSSKKVSSDPKGAQSTTNGASKVSVASQSTATETKTNPKKYTSKRPTKTVPASGSTTSKEGTQSTTATNVKPLDPKEIEEKLSFAIELYDFPEDYKINKFLNIFESPRYVKKCDDKHVLLILGSAKEAQEALTIKRRFFKSRPMTEASPQTVQMAAKCVPAGRLKPMTWVKRAPKKLCPKSQDAECPDNPN